MFKNFVVSGGVGFIGSVLVEKLVENNNFVKVLTIKSDESLKNKKNVEYRKVDITKKETLKNIFSDSDCFFHFAAILPKPGIRSSLSEYIDVNATGTLNLMDACVKSHVKCIVYASTHEVYGMPKYLPVDENHPVSSFLDYATEKDKKNPENERLFYSASKILAENYVLSISEKYGIKCYILRFSNVFGPNASQKGAILNFIENLSNERPPVIFGDGNQQRDYIFVDDVVSANLLTINKLPKSKIFNIGSGKGYKVIEVANHVIEVYKKYFHKGNSIKPVFKPSKEEFSKYLDISLAKRELGFNPNTDLRDGIKKTAFWYEYENVKQK